MIYKHLRFLILDDIHAHTAQIEKMLNLLGCYRIATATTAEEGALLSEACGKRFDVVIASERVLDLHYQNSVAENFYINHLFIYSCTSREAHAKVQARGTSCYKSGLPEFHVLEKFIASLEVASCSCVRYTDV
jgi:uncharacterized linocin/CFP29 family protein